MENKSKTKQIIILRTDLKKLKKGKAIAQGSHASVNALLNDNNQIDLNDEALDWLHGDQTKICLKCDNEEHLLKIYQKAKSLGLKTSLIQDKGYTCFDEPTYTAVAIGPHWNEKLKSLTEDLLLY